MIYRMTDPANWRKLIKHGNKGSDVCAWQLVLLEHGHTLSDVVGVFGDTTHNATMAWQHVRKLEPDGVVGPKTKAALAVPIEIDPPVIPGYPETIKYVEARNWSRHLKPREVVNWVVMHCMEAPESSTRAERCAANFAREDARKASAHYCVDADSIVQCVKEDKIAWHAPGANKKGIGIEHAGYARQSREEWLDLFGQSMLALSAKLTARICNRWNIPVVAVDIEGLKNGDRGITTHAAVGKAFKKSRHWDPGPGFPMDWYVEAVQVELDKLKRSEPPT